ncbi:MAG TPA: cyclase family protein [Steroidobacteraceae bacterium]|nr:cyclase family protein [Steroidobacteraceae bacterium]
MNRLEFSVQGCRWRADIARPIDLAIPLDFAGPQPRFFAGSPARAEPLRAGSFTGSVAAGASCNCATYTLSPHCHGTHTECVGHVSAPAASLASFTPVAPALALLVSVVPRALGAEATGAHAAADDPVIDRRSLELAAARWREAPWTALVVRTLPNPPSKRHRAYSGSACPAPYFRPDAMAWLAERGVSSLIVDLPSLDRADDGGALAAHRVYWGLPAGSSDVRAATRARALVTELAYVPDDVRDGLYLLDLQVPAFVADAAPSRPVLYALADSLPEPSA